MNIQSILDKHFKFIGNSISTQINELNARRKRYNNDTSDENFKKDQEKLIEQGEETIRLKVEEAVKNIEEYKKNIVKKAFTVNDKNNEQKQTNQILLIQKQLESANTDEDYKNLIGNFGKDELIYKYIYADIEKKYKANGDFDNLLDHLNRFFYDMKAEREINCVLYSLRKIINDKLIVFNPSQRALKDEEVDFKEIRKYIIEQSK
jgi:hypothetical protein